MKHNSSCNKITKIYKYLSKNGFEIIKTKNGVKIKNIKNNDVYLLHYSDRAYHPLRRWLKQYNINIESHTY
jgi:hypothetical protein